MNRYLLYHPYHKGSSIAPPAPEKSNPAMHIKHLYPKPGPPDLLPASSLFSADKSPPSLPYANTLHPPAYAYT